MSARRFHNQLQQSSSLHSRPFNECGSASSHFDVDLAMQYTSYSASYNKQPTAVPIIADQVALPTIAGEVPNFIIIYGSWST